MGGLATTWWPPAHMTQEALDAFIHRTPAEAGHVFRRRGSIQNELVSLLMKLIYTWRLESGRQFADAIKLPSTLWSTGAA